MSGTPRRTLAALVFLICTATAANAEAGEFSPSVGDICRAETEAAETENRLPKLILGAISLAESGRWHRSERESYPWPWTVTSGGSSHYFKDKLSAIDAVRRLQGQGVRNIDVGCMQINLYYHADAFADLEEAFDPTANVAYAAHFLKQLFKETRSWNAAIGRYHSATPERAAGYLERVSGLWHRERVRVATVRREAVIAAYHERQAALREAREARSGS
jgi:hypothetical protein